MNVERPSTSITMPEFELIVPEEKVTLRSIALRSVKQSHVVFQYTGVPQDIVRCAVGNFQFVCLCGLAHGRVIMYVAFFFFSGLC